MGRCLARVAVIAVVTIFSSVLAPDLLAQSAENGRSLFEQSCSSCHTIGGGPLVGPDLEGVTSRRAPDELELVILEPEALGLSMPNLGLTPEQATDIIAYLAAESGDPPPEPPAPAPAEEPPPAAPPEPSEEPPAEPPAPEPIAEPAAPSAGDADRGKDLFTGSTRFEKEGAPCLSCHTMAGISSLGGGTLGPDLTGVYDRLGDNYIAFLGAGTMAPIFDDKPLTEQEQADLTAYVSAAPAGPDPSSAGAAARFAAIGIGGTLLLVAVGLIVWRKRLGPVRKRLVGEHSTTQGK